MAMTYKALSAILSYPTTELQEAADELIAALDCEHLLSAQHRAAVVALIRDVTDGDLLDVQSAYVDLFDRTRALSLYLFEHVHGESRDRGQAMVSLRERYRRASYDIAANELPDYLPLFLEFLSLAKPEDAQAMLAETAHILAALAERLKRRGSSYAAVLEALLSLARTKPDDAALAQLRGVELDDPDDLAALDHAWEETEVRFGAGEAQDGCARGLRKTLHANPKGPREPSRRKEAES